LWCLVTRYAFNMSRKVDRQISKVAANTAFVLAGGGSLGMTQVQRIVAWRHRYLPPHWCRANSTPSRSRARTNPVTVTMHSSVAETVLKLLRRRLGT
jgi:hypothetical protein